MEIVAAEMAGDVDDLTDEKQSVDLLGLHRFAGQIGSVDSTGSDFGFFIAFGAGWCYGPGVQLLLKSGEAQVRVVGRLICLEPTGGHAIR